MVRGLWVGHLAPVLIKYYERWQVTPQKRGWQENPIVPGPFCHYQTADGLNDQNFKFGVVRDYFSFCLTICNYILY